MKYFPVGGHHNKYLFLIALGFYLLMTFPVLQHIPVTMDEVLFAEPARNFIEHGHFGTTSLTGLFKFSEKTYWQHPLYLAFMYLPLWLFGYSCWSIKFLSAFIGLFALLYASRIGKKFNVPYLFPVLLVFNVLFIFMARTGRMEMLILCLSLASFYYALEEKPGFCGFTGSLALLTHPVGFFSVLNGAILLRQKGYLNKKFFAGLGIPFLAAFSLLMIWDFNEFVRQYFTVQRYLYENSGWLGGPLTQLENFIAFLIEARQWIFWLAPLFILLIIGLFKPQSRQLKTLMIIQVINFLGLVLIVPNKYINYYVALVLPYTALYVAYSFRKHRSIPMIILLVVFLVANAIGIAKSSYYYQNSCSNIISLRVLMEPNSKILAAPALAPHLKDYQVIGFHNIRMIMDLENKSLAGTFNEIEPRYIVVDPSIAGFSGWPLFTSNQEGLGDFIKKNTEFCGKAMVWGEPHYVFEFK